MRFGDKLKYLRNLHRYSQRDVEARTGLYQSKLSDWESGKEAKRGAHPKREQLLALARLYNVSLEYLCDDSLDDPATPTPPASLPEEYRALLRMVQKLGPDVAMERLMLAPDVAPGRAEPAHPAPQLPTPTPPPTPTRGEKTPRDIPKPLKPEDGVGNGGGNDHDGNKNHGESGGKKRRGRPPKRR